MECCSDVHEHQTLSVAAVQENARKGEQQYEHGTTNFVDNGGNAQSLEHR
jgi:hypothetical protein